MSKPSCGAPLRDRSARTRFVLGFPPGRWCLCATRGGATSVGKKAGRRAGSAKPADKRALWLTAQTVGIGVSLCCSGQAASSTRGEVIGLLYGHRLSTSASRTDKQALGSDRGGAGRLCFLRNHSVAGHVWRGVRWKSRRVLFSRWLAHRGRAPQLLDDREQEIALLERRFAISTL